MQREIQTQAAKAEPCVPLEDVGCMYDLKLHEVCCGLKWTVGLSTQWAGFAFERYVTGAQQWSDAVYLSRELLSYVMP